MNLGSTSEIFRCHVCSKEWQDRDSRKRGYDHAKRTGHFVTGEVVTAYHYGVKVEAPSLHSNGGAK